MVGFEKAGIAIDGLFGWFVGFVRCAMGLSFRLLGWVHTSMFSFDRFALDVFLLTGGEGTIQLK